MRLGRRSHRVSCFLGQKKSSSIKFVIISIFRIKFSKNMLHRQLGRQLGHQLGRQLGRQLGCFLETDRFFGTWSRMRRCKLRTPYLDHREQTRGARHSEAAKKFATFPPFSSLPISGRLIRSCQCNSAPPVRGESSGVGRVSTSASRALEDGLGLWCRESLGFRRLCVQPKATVRSLHRFPQHMSGAHHVNGAHHV